MSAGGARFFPNDYSEARERFRAAATRAGARLTARRNPHGLGPNGEDLTVDCALLGEEAPRRLVVVQSGTHGVEGFCGSGCQIGLLETGLLDALPPDLGVLLIHALNPYGFAWLRRVNEDNIDLNRNFLDHDGPYPDNPGYEILKDALAPTSFDEAVLRQANRTLADYAARHGLAALQSAITKGQYAYPDGLYYGGRGPAWSNLVFRELITTFGAAVEDAVLIDIHTGLGAHGQGEVICETAPDDPAFQRARAFWGSRVASTVTGDSVSSHLSGTIDPVLGACLPGACATAVALEFGTAPAADVFKATRADNWLHCHGDPRGPEAKTIKDEIRRAFFPGTEDWMERVWATARETIAKVMV